MLVSKNKKQILFLFALCSSQFLLAQVSGNEADSSLKPSNAYVLHFIPSVKDNVYGIAIGPIGSETICNVTNTRKSYGINLQLIGQGIFIPMNRKVFSFEQLLLNPMPDLINQIACKAMHSGILISTFGTYTDISNGIVLSLGFSYGRKLNGIAFNLCSGKYITVNGMELGIQNQAHTVNGLQLGLLNRCVQLNGLQIGLWNVNEKRKLPIINW
jgi:hypothetical protein